VIPACEAHKFRPPVFRQDLVASQTSVGNVFMRKYPTVEWISRQITDTSPSDVRYTPESRHSDAVSGCPLCAINDQRTLAFE
jgi:hypothetical protein